MWKEWFQGIYLNNSKDISEHQGRHLNVFWYIWQIYPQYKEDGKQVEGYKQLLKKTLWCCFGTWVHKKLFGQSDRFDAQESTFILHNRRFIDVFSDLCKKFVKWPNNAEKQEIMSEFEDFSGFPGVIGAIDRTHISITPPGENEVDYVNRKSFHSIIL